MAAEEDGGGGLPCSVAEVETQVVMMVAKRRKIQQEKEKEKRDDHRLRCLQVGWRAISFSSSSKSMAFVLYYYKDRKTEISAGLVIL